MSFGTLYIGNAGLLAQQLGIDTIANNIANANTTGYKTSRVTFQETLVRTVRPARPEVAGAAAVNPQQVGLGARRGAVIKDFRQGGFLPTGLPTDIAIEGNGFFIVQGFGDQPAQLYTRDGSFHVDSQTTGDRIRFANADGNLLLGRNATVSAETGLMTLPSTGLGLAPEVIEIDVAAGLPGRATSTIDFRGNLFSLQPLAMDPVALETSNQGVDNTFRIEFRRAAAGTRDLFFFRATSPVQNQPQGDYTTLTDNGGGAIQGQGIEGVVEFDDAGRVIDWFSTSADADGDGFLTPAEVQALAPWAERTTTAVTNEAHGTANGVTVPSPFTLGTTVVNAASVVIRSNGVVQALGTDYTFDAITGTVTPLTVWPAGPIDADYTFDTPFFTVGQGSVVVTGEVATDGLGNPLVPNGSTVLPSFVVAQPPIQAGTLVVNATVGGVPVVEGTDYTVDLVTGVVRPITAWDAAANVTLDYTRADTRERIDFDSRGSDRRTIRFESVVTNQAAVGTIAPPDETKIGLAIEFFDSRSDAHSLGVRFERLETNRWMYEATPTLRETLTSAVVIDTAFDGGASAATVTLDNTGAIAADPMRSGLFQVKVEVDEGGGFVEFAQIAASAPFVLTGPGTREFKVVGGTTSAPTIAFSRDLDVRDPLFRVRVTRTLAAPAGTGLLEFDSAGNLTSAPVVQALSVPLTLATSPLAMNLDFTALFQQGSATTATALQDGFRRGDLVEFEFDDRGRIVGLYSNGKTQPLGQVLLALFPNNGGLEALGRNLFQEGANAGDPTIAFAGESGLGTIRPKTLEGSNVDLSVELVDLILMQRIYQFNSRIITTADEMIQEAIRAKR